MVVYSNIGYVGGWISKDYYYQVISLYNVLQNISYFDDMTCNLEGLCD